MMKKAILTGASGNLGKEFLRNLITNDYEVYAVDKDIKSLHEFKQIIPIE